MTRKASQPKAITRSKIILPIIIGGLILCNVMATVFISAEGTKLAAVEKDLSESKSENRRLSSELVSSSSLSEIKKGVDEGGFVEPENTIYLFKDLPVASLPDNI